MYTAVYYIWRLRFYKQHNVQDSRRQPDDRLPVRPSRQADQADRPDGIV